MGTKESAVSLHVFHQIYFILYRFAILCSVYIHLLSTFTYYRTKCILYIVHCCQVNHTTTVYVSKYHGIFLYIVTCIATEDAVQIVNSFITILNHT
jgi:hypothetical protein